MIDKKDQLKEKVVQDIPKAIKSLKELIPSHSAYSVPNCRNKQYDALTNRLGSYLGGSVEDAPAPSVIQAFNQNNPHFKKVYLDKLPRRICGQIRNFARLKIL